MAGVRRPNRGPSAAAANRAALIAAAREVFAANGYDAPLSMVAKAAGVGQGSLYRHFPDRISLALAVFEDGVAELEALAAEPGATLDDLLTLITEQTIASTALIEMVSVPPADTRMIQLRDRVADLLAGALEEARRAGRVRADLTADDLVLAVGMLAGVLAKRPAPARRVAAVRVWELLRRGMGA
ncbi:helix-turn-helix domain-containing protein [Nonomuraea sp. NPDC046802]|uniref:helix-turn-helix domain-containing protein n=1 Tax=Nonomuraea sp. NPDC046802 TaxID=3154919 RepID=UPI0033EB9B18